TISGVKIFVCGEADSTGYLFALDMQGKQLWKTGLGREWMVNFTGPRTTPTVVDSLLYVCNSLGILSCIEVKEGKKLWSVDMQKDLHGINVRFGYSESLLVEGDQVWCTPGGKDTNIVALNRFTGKIQLISKGDGDTTAYCSPRIIHHNGKKILMTLSIHHLVGIDATTGQLLWSQLIDKGGDIHCNTPWYENGFIYYVTGGNGTVKLELSPDGKTLTELWRVATANDVHGGFVKLGDFLYTSQYKPKRYVSIDTRNGMVADSLKSEKGVTISAEGMLYCYTEKGTMMLVRPDNGKMTLVSSFKLPVGTKEFFSNPVIDQGILYIRHQDDLVAYRVREL
ncbi:MAG: PQQ-binding-like beta-propeller repeat protein, partial [Syntrophothermus sp.]